MINFSNIAISNNFILNKMAVKNFKLKNLYKFYENIKVQAQLKLTKKAVNDYNK